MKNNKKQTVAVIGIGRVGLPMALVLADEGFKVYGIGRNQKKIDEINKGIIPFIEEGAPPLLKKYVTKNFFPTISYDVIKNCDVIIFTLGTPIDENMNPVLDQINTALDSSIPYLKKGQLIILRSTVSPTTTDYVKDTIEIKTKFKVGEDLFLAFCPERIAEGKAIEEIKELPQIVGGVDEESSRVAKDFFESFGVNCVVTDVRSAELAKLFTNMYRYITFAIANEFMVIAEGFNRNIHQIVNLVNQGYKRGGLALPGPAAGPCLFKDGFFLINEYPFLDLIAASWKINENLPLFLVKKLRERMIFKGKKIVIMGLAFKPEIDDIRESLSFKIRKALLREHANVVLHDPFVKHYANGEVLSDYQTAFQNADAIIIATRHKEYFDRKNEIIKMLSPKTYICDVWNIFGINKLVYTVNQINIFSNNKS
jgi:UDP-N-acetyl-D-mannosaminuronic acid dehydrogenase